ncbi:uncharacterized protein LOC108431854 isoform X1 [Pygocentrus nattereri]|uniref:uncharacterized protein LOC108431854 isoform X1 n=2 Tax=Pygocentrus nattereri TaxID=42514 RepID=UPI00081488AC|nr:uncharacterized protein LOC108431854 isoform X1 [Pygocentrus nattereri]
MARLKHVRPNRSRGAGSGGKVNVAAPESRVSRSMTPMRISRDLPSYLHKMRRNNGLDLQGRGVMKLHGRRFEGRRVYSKGTVTPSTKDPSQDSTSMIMPSGVSSFLLDCMDSDSEAEDTLPSIEMVRKADSYDEGTALVSEDEILHRHIKNSTLLDLSHAVDIAMQQPPNLSSILELSPVLHGQAAKEWFCLSPFSPSPLTKSASTKNTAGSNYKTFGAEERTPETKRVVVLSPVVKRRPLTGQDKPMKCRKVTFNDIVSTRDITMLKPQMECQSRACDVQKAELRGNTVIGEREELMEPQELSSETAKFFDFADESEKQLFFQRLKRTCTFHFPTKPITFTDFPQTEDVRS